MLMVRIVYLLRDGYLIQVIQILLLILMFYDGSTLIIPNYPANKYRSDLSAMGNGYHAFEINTPASLRDGQSHTLHFKASGCNYTLNSSPRVLCGCSNAVVDMTGADGWADQKLNMVVSPNPNKGIF